MGVLFIAFVYVCVREHVKVKCNFMINGIEGLKSPPLFDEWRWCVINV